MRYGLSKIIAPVVAQAAMPLFLLPTEAAEDSVGVLGLKRGNRILSERASSEAFDAHRKDSVTCKV